MTSLSAGEGNWEGFPRQLPAPLRALGPRQREIASIIYSASAATPRDVRERLAEPGSVRVVRTLLDRMATKGIVKRRRSGRHSEVIYVAAIATPQVKEAAVRKLADEQFGGSLADAAAAIVELAKQRDRIPRTSADLKRLMNENTVRSLS